MAPLVKVEIIRKTEGERMTFEAKVKALIGISVPVIFAAFVPFEALEQDLRYDDFAAAERHFGTPKFAM